jgi:hypothetical protein
MMDLVSDTTDSPFSWQVGWACLDLYDGTGKLTGLYLRNNTTIGSTFNSEKSSYENCLKKVMEKFASFE